MANILTIISKESEKGNDYVTKTGDFVSEQKKETEVKKACINYLKDHSLDDLEQFKEKKEREYIPAVNLYDAIVDYISETFFSESEQEESDSANS